MEIALSVSTYHDKQLVGLGIGVDVRLPKVEFEKEKKSADLYFTYQTYVLCRKCQCLMVRFVPFPAYLCVFM